MPPPEKRSLPRLTKEAYLGHVSVFWTHTIHNRNTGWLTPSFHQSFRELLCHMLARYSAICPVYCLMPDHIHLLISGIDASSDQLRLTKLFRKEFNGLICPHKLQSQAHDHVLREEELERSAFQSVAHYILQNPIRKNLVENWKDYPFKGCVVPGYFDLDPRKHNFWGLFWRIHNKLVCST